jgi:hypothetical protein
LIEYLENLYKEESIDLDSFANYNSGSSLGFKSLDDSNDISSNNINKFLSYNNVWTIEKVTSEFKTIHANKVAFTQTIRSRSPSPLNGAQSRLNIKTEN